MSNESLNQVTDDDFQAVAQWVFKQTMDDIKRRVHDPALSGDRYQILGIAPLLRKLLIDGGNLVQAVNRRYKLGLSFQIAPFDIQERELYEIITSSFPKPAPTLKELGYWRLFAPGLLMPNEDRPGESLTLPHFLAAHVGIVNGHRLSVRELVKFYCIVEGGVHIGMPRQKFEKDMLMMVPSELVMPNWGVDNSPISSLYVCAEIVILALEPLLEAIENDPVEPIPKPDILASSQGAPRHWKG